jgi:hypothetical protein
MHVGTVDCLKWFFFLLWLLVSDCGYRKDKTSFWNHLHLSPVRSATGEVHYITVTLFIEELIGICLKITSYCSGSDRMSILFGASRIDAFQTVKLDTRGPHLLSLFEVLECGYHQDVEWLDCGFNHIVNPGMEFNSTLLNTTWILTAH